VETPDALREGGGQGLGNRSAPVTTLGVKRLVAQSMHLKLNAIQLAATLFYLTILYSNLRHRQKIRSSKMSSQSKSTFYQIVENPGTMSEVESHFPRSRREPVTGNRRHDHLKDEILISSEMFFFACLSLKTKMSISFMNTYLKFGKRRLKLCFLM